MKKITLTKGKFAIVDDEDYPYLSRFAWCNISRHSNTKNEFLDNERVVTFIASHKNKSIFVSMGKFLVDNNKNDSFVILHKNNNSFDFRKENLFLKSFSYKKIREGKYEMKRKPTSQYKGVYKKYCNISTKHLKIWSANIRKNNIKYHIGTFYSEEEAALAYNKKARELYGEFAYQNIIKD